MIKKITKKEEVDLDELAEMSGENSVRRFRYIVPVLKFNGSTNKWSLLNFDDSGTIKAEDLNQEIEFVILKVRRSLGSYEKLPDQTGLRTFTNEHNSWKDPLTVFEMKKGDDRPMMIDVGTTQDIRKRFPKLKLRQILYCLFNEQVVKFSVKGKSLSSLFAYHQTFKASEHFFQFVTKVSSHEETNEGGLTYFTLDWMKDKLADLPEVAKRIKEVKSSLELQDKQYAERGTADEAPLIEESDAKVELEPGEDEEEVKVPTF